MKATNPIIGISLFIFISILLQLFLAVVEPARWFEKTVSSMLVVCRETP
ncbi:MAG: hypothetical protein LBD14_02205 [Puniceicoccales bacterium]|jgi:hypothetical protein|nr:hypothetical protein [Puniceicoccales bacterium]